MGDDVKSLKKEVEALQREFDKKKREYESEIKAANRKADEEEEKVKELQKKYDAQQAEAAKLPKEEISAMKKKAEDSDKVVKYLKKENTRMRKETEQMEEDMVKMKETNSRLIEANASAGASLESLNKQAKVIEDHNKKLEVGIGKYKDQNKTLANDLKGRTKYIEHETQTRNDYENAMEEIVKLMEDRCDDSELVEKIMTAQLTCVTNIAKK